MIDDRPEGDAPTALPEPAKSSSPSRPVLIVVIAAFALAIVGAAVAAVQVLDPADATEAEAAATDPATGESSTDSATASTGVDAAEQDTDAAATDSTPIDLGSALPPPTATSPLESPHDDGVTIVGDSLVVATEPLLRDAIPDVEIDAVVGRQFSSGVQIVAALRRADELTDTVVVELGTNGYVSESQMDAMLLLLSDVENVIFVNVRVPRDWEDNVNGTIDRAAASHDPVTVIDWYDHTEASDELLAGDGYHLSSTGYREYAQLIAFFATTA